MCSIFGALCTGLDDRARRRANAALNHIVRLSHRRGRDGRGWDILSDAGLDEVHDISRATEHDWSDKDLVPKGATRCAIIGNTRAEPTTEFVAQKRPEDQQPYSLRGWAIVHNGTIANDKELRTNQVPTAIDSAAIVERLAEEAPFGADISRFTDIVQRLKGSYALAATNVEAPDTILLAANYRPLWYATTSYGIFFASCREFFPASMKPQMLTPYTAAKFRAGERYPETQTLRPYKDKRRALVVCSGGLDSVVAATWAKRKAGFDIELAHFQYGSRAEGPEVRAVQAVGDALGCPVRFLPMGIYDPADSPLLREEGAIAGGEAGAEFAHEWVPARNLVMLALATAYAEAKGFDFIILGNNLEEAGAYPDNEPEFIDRFNDLLPFAVGDGKRVEILMPMGNYMKHEIVAFGHTYNAPLHLTWSCYRAGDKHCGTCGPCFMRRTAFAINQLNEVIEYEKE